MVSHYSTDLQVAVNTQRKAVEKVIARIGNSVVNKAALKILLNIGFSKCFMRELLSDLKNTLSGE